MQTKSCIYKPNNFNFIGVLFFIICFSSYLTSPIVIYGFQIIGVGVIGFVFFIKSNFSLGLKNSIFYFLFCFFLVLITFIQSFYLVHQEILWLQVARILFWFYVCYISYPFLSRVSPFDYERAIKIVICVFSFSLIFQFVAFYFFNFYIDYSELIGGVPSRIYFNGLFRPSGFTSEPAIYSGIMIGLMTLLFILNKNSRFYFTLGLISVFLSMSVLGILLGMAFILISFGFFKEVKRIPLVFLLLFLVVLFTGNILFDRYDAFISGGDGSNASKIVSFQNMFNNDALTYLGYGFNGSTENTPWFYEGLYDVTAYGSFIIAFGIPLGIVVNIFLLFNIFALNYSFTEKALIVLVFMKITLPIICFFVFFLMAINLFSKQRECGCVYLS